MSRLPRYQQKKVAQLKARMNFGKDWVFKRIKASAFALSDLAQIKPNRAIKSQEISAKKGAE